MISAILDFLLNYVPFLFGVVAAAVAYFLGRREGKSDAVKSTLKNVVKRNEAVENIDALSDDDIHNLAIERMRKPK